MFEKGRLDVVDTQAHIGPGRIGETLAAMDALGIRGLFNNDMRAMNPMAKRLTEEEQLALYDRVLALSDYPNIGLKWAHYSTMFQLPAYPGTRLTPILRKTIDAFGAERLMWASDFSVNQSGDTWGELLYGIRGNTELTEKERAALLGGTARRWLDWKCEE